MDIPKGYELSRNSRISEFCSRRAVDQRRKQDRQYGERILLSPAQKAFPLTILIFLVSNVTFAKAS